MKQEDRLLQKGRGPKDGVETGGRKRGWRMIKMCYVRVPTFLKECKHYVLHTCINKLKFRNVLIKTTKLLIWSEISWGYTREEKKNELVNIEGVYSVKNLQINNQKYCCLFIQVVIKNIELALKQASEFMELNYCILLVRKQKCRKIIYKIPN